MQNEAHIDNAEEEYVLPSVEAVLAGTLALMTGYAQSARGCPHRAVMADKLVSNLFVLSGHPQLSPPMRAMLANLRTRWQLERDNSAPPAESPTSPGALWHSVPASVQ